jgi:hypothetical protein
MPLIHGGLRIFLRVIRTMLNFPIQEVKKSKKEKTINSKKEEERSKHLIGRNFFGESLGCF